MINDSQYYYGNDVLDATPNQEIYYPIVEGVNILAKDV